MKWGFVLFGLMLAGFGVVYLVWPETIIIARYGVVALNTGLLLTCLSMSRTTQLAPERSWQRSAFAGFAIGFWMWLIAAILEVLELELNLPAYGSKADTFWVLGYLPMFYGLYARVKNVTTPKNRPVWIILLLGFTYCAVFYAYLFPRLSDPIRNLPEKTLDVLYMSFNFALLGMLLTIARSLALPADPLRYCFRQMSAATVIMTAADLLLSYFTDRRSAIYQVLDLPYYVVYFLFFIAAESARQYLPATARMKDATPASLQ